MDTDDFAGPDLVVAGAGGGLVAAVRAAELGLSVLVIDSNERFRRGNNTSMSTAMIPAMGTRYQREQGIDDSPENFLSDVDKKTGGDFNRVAATSLAEVSTELVEWLADHVGLEISLMTDFIYPGHSVARCHTIPGHSGAAMLSSLASAAEKHELIDILTPATLTEVQATDGQVSGVVISTPDGPEEIPARAVLLATNGYGADPRLVERYMPEIAGAIYYGSEHSRGDALRIGESLGAAVDFLDAYQGHAALAMPSAMLATWATIMHGGFMVGRDGTRYGNEASGYSEYAAVSMAHAAEGSWIIIDERIYDACSGFQDFKDVIDGGGVKWGDNASDLALTIGVDPAGLQQTLEDTRSYTSGASKDPTGRSVWGEPLTGRLAAIRVQPALFHTQGGLRVDEHARVVKESGDVVQGLYAAGGAAAGISGHGAAGYLAGNGLLTALGLSYIAATHAGAAQQG
jgi:fumarate reductase flavoprotein subunit